MCVIFFLRNGSGTPLFYSLVCFCYCLVVIVFFFFFSCVFFPSFPSSALHVLAWSWRGRRKEGRKGRRRKGREGKGEAEED